MLHISCERSVGKSAFYFPVQLIAEKAPRCLSSRAVWNETSHVCGIFQAGELGGGEIVAMSMVVMWKADEKGSRKRISI